LCEFGPSVEQLLSPTYRAPAPAGQRLPRFHFPRFPCKRACSDAGGLRGKKCGGGAMARAEGSDFRDINNGAEGLRGEGLRGRGLRTSGSGELRN